MSSRRLPPSKGEGDSRDSLQARGTEPDDLGMPLQAPVSFETRGDQTIEHPPGRSSARELDAELTKAEQRPSEVIDGAVVPARKTVGEQWHHGPREDVAPSNAWDLIDRFFARLTWNTAGPITVVLIALGDRNITLAFGSIRRPGRGWGVGCQVRSPAASEEASAPRRWRQ
jgi:hypothetical protein